ncbi:hypothetical protein ILUMI_21812 [Ignelater luminosus]|uniref:Uncharacterized protein n=1 Tax=Ignelater luminosus TaxID=2038154 RepID=A0A8K0CBS0_IGNLU|nr:hypothetical protein ILUMI_21812 [Ignelater luminosus]
MFYQIRAHLVRSSIDFHSVRPRHLNAGRLAFGVDNKYPSFEERQVQQDVKLTLNGSICSPFKGLNLRFNFTRNNARIQEIQRQNENIEALTAKEIGTQRKSPEIANTLIENGKTEERSSPILRRRKRDGEEKRANKKMLRKHYTVHIKSSGSNGLDTGSYRNQSSIRNRRNKIASVDCRMFNAALQERGGYNRQRSLVNKYVANMNATVYENVNNLLGTSVTRNKQTIIEQLAALYGKKPTLHHLRVVKEDSL